MEELMSMHLEDRLGALETKLDQLLDTLNHHLSGNSRGQQSESERGQGIDDQLVDLEQAAIQLGISPGHLRNLQWAEKLPHYRIGTCVRFQVAELKGYFRKKPRR